MQTSYEPQADSGYHGQVASTYPNGIVTVVLTEAVLPGQAVCRDATAGTVDNAARMPAAAGDCTKPELIGFVVRDETKEGGGEFPAGYPVAVLKKGEMFLNTEDALGKYANPFIRHTAAGAEVQGSLRSDADGTDATQNTSIRSLTAAGAGAVCKFEIDL